MKWYNGCGDGYEPIEKVKRNKRTTCRACREGNSGGVEKPEDVVEITTHFGPAGSMMLCKPHALEFAEMIIKSAEEIR